jgi:hypothetical protein
MAETPVAEPIRLATIRVDEMKPTERECVTDTELMRETLAELRAQWSSAHVNFCENLSCKGGGKWCMWPPPNAITKLEERLLREGD